MARTRPVAVTVLLLAAALPVQGRAASGTSAGLSPAGGWPLSFERNQGQSDARVAYLSRSPARTLWVAPDEAVLALGDPARVLRLRVSGGRAAEVRGEEPLAGRSHYLRGRDPSRWTTDVAHFGRVRLREVLPCVDLVFHGSEGALEYDLVLAPGGDPRAIALELEGARSLALAPGGDLLLDLGGATVVQRAPVVYQEAGGRRQPVAGAYVLLADGRVGFEVGPHDRDLPLVIDPILHYGTYLGGSGWEGASGLAVGADGSTHVAGTTQSADFPTVGPLQPLRGTGDAFVARLDPAGATLLHATYLGGDGYEEAGGLALDAAGSAYLVGTTSSADFPVTAGALQGSLRGASDAFVAKLAPDGRSLAYATYLGGSAQEGPGGAIAVDAAGKATVATTSWSSDFPVTPGAFQPALAGLDDAVVVRLEPAGSALAFATYLGGSGEDWSAALAVDDAGDVYLTGGTGSFDFPVRDAIQPAGGGQRQYDAFVTRLASGGSALVYSTYLGGPWTDSGTGIALDPTGGVVVAGDTWGGFPVHGALQPNPCGEGDAFVAKLNPMGNAFVYSTYLCSSGRDEGGNVTVDADGDAYVTGSSDRDDFPLSEPPQDPVVESQVFLTQLTRRGDDHVRSVFLGPGGGATGPAGPRALVARAASDDLHLAGSTWSTAFPVTPGAFQPAPGGGGDAFVARLLATRAASARIVPRRGGDRGRVTAVVYRFGGPRLAPGATLRLVRAGEADRVASGVAVSPSGRSASGTFDLTGAALGAWDVVLTAPDGFAWTIAQGFTVEPWRPAELWVDVVGASPWRTGFPRSFQFRYGNRGNTDLAAVPVWIGGIPTDALVQLGAVEPPLLLPGQDPVDWTGFGAPVVAATELLVPFLVPLLPPGTSGHATVTLTLPTSRQFTVRLWANPAQVVPPSAGHALDCWEEATRVEAEAALADLRGAVLPAACLPPIRADVASFLEGEVDAALARAFEASRRVSLRQALASLVQVTAICADPGFASVPIADLAPYADRGMERMSDAPGGFPACSRARYLQALRSRVLETRAAYDPNVKTGALGVGPEQWLSAAEPLRYVVHFENLDTATAPAQAVTLTDVLPPELDLERVSLGEVAFADRVVAAPPGSDDLLVDLDLRPDPPLVVRVDARLDRASRTLTFALSSFDPATGRPPADPLVGFLPPNLAPPAGQGHVSFTVFPAPGLPTGTRVENAASIVFDANPPIDTPAWPNTLDADAPASAVAPLPPLQACAAFALSWSASDVGSGVAEVAILVARDGGPFEEWLVAPGAGSATFAGEPGRSYAFASVARDGTGNREEAPALPDATTAVDPGAGTPLGSVGNALKVGKEAGGLRFTWRPLAGAVDYAVLAGALPAGPFDSEVASAADPSSGLLAPVPSGDTAYRVAGRDACGSLGEP